MSNDEPNLKAFGKILSFMKDLKECFDKDFPEIVKYYSLCKKTTFDNTPAINKQNAVFLEYCLLNKEAIKSGQANQLNDANIVYNPKFQFNIKALIAKADKQAIKAIMAHLKVILCVLQPDDELKTELISKAKKPKKEEQLFNNLLDKMGNIENVQNITDVNSAIQELKGNGVIDSMVTEVSQGLANDEFSIKDLLSTATTMFDKVKSETGDDPSMGGMISMVENLMKSAMGQMGNLDQLE